MLEFSTTRLLRECQVDPEIWGIQWLMTRVANIRSENAAVMQKESRKGQDGVRKRGQRLYIIGDT